MTSKLVTFTSGISAEVHPVPLFAQADMRARIMQKHDVTQIPIIETPVETAGGSHVERRAAPPESEEYKAYLERQNEAMAEWNAKIIGLNMELALFDVPLPTDDGWLKRLQRLGVVEAIPDDEDERRALYIRYTVVLNNSDVDLLLKTVNEVSEVTEEGIQQKMDSFRDKPGRGAVAGADDQLNGQGIRKQRAVGRGKDRLGEE